MYRRQFLATATLSTAALAGCGGGSSETPVVTPNPDDPMLFVLRNESEGARTVALTLSREETALIDESVTLDAGASREFDPEIDTPGGYELTVDVEGGPTRTLSLTIEAADIETGSNHTVSIRPSSIQITWEE